MNISINKNIAPVIITLAIELCSAPKGITAVSAEKPVTLPDENSYVTETSDTDEEPVSYDLYADDSMTVSVDDDKTKDENSQKGPRKESEPLSCSEVSGDSPVSFSTEVYPCSDKDAKDGYILITINEDEEGTYSCSFNGGKNFRPMSKKSAVFSGLGEGSYSIVIMNNKSGAVSEIHTVALYPEPKRECTDISANSLSENIYKDGKIMVHINNFNAKKSYQVTSDGGNTWQDVNGSTAYLYFLEGGAYSVMVREKDDDKSRSAELEIQLMKYSHRSSNFIKTECIMQNPELPTGCEITSLAMLLVYMGYDADKLDLADNYLPKGEYQNSDFYEVFVGDPRSTSAYGCFSPAIVKAAQKYIDDKNDTDKWKIRNITGCSLGSLYAAADKGYPSVVWASMNMMPIEAGKSWTVAKTGKTLTWTANEHCMLFVGYNIEKGLVYVNDPLKGTVAYKKDDFERVFLSLGSQAIIIEEK